MSKTDTAQLRQEMIAKGLIVPNAAEVVNATCSQCEQGFQVIKGFAVDKLCGSCQFSRKQRK